MAPLLLPIRNMPEPEDNLERKVVVETVSSTSTRSSGITIAIVVVIAIALIVWIVLQMR